MALQTYQLVAGDWIGLERIINDLTGRVIGQSMGPTSSPTFAGMTLTGLSGVLQATAGVLSGDADHNSLENIQGGDTNEYYHLTSAEYTAIGGFISEEADPLFNAWLAATPPLYSFTESDPIAMGYIDQSVKQAASPTFAGLTLSNLTGILKGTSGVVSAITDNSSNWNTAYGWGQGLKLDQTTPQTVINGSPIFNVGLKIIGNTKFNLFQGAGAQAADLTYTLPTAYPASAAFLKISSAGVMSTDITTYQASFSGTTVTDNFITDIQWNVTKLQIKTREIAFANGVATVGNKSGWTDVATV